MDAERGRVPQSAKAPSRLSLKEVPALRSSARSLAAAVLFRILPSPCARLQFLASGEETGAAGRPELAEIQIESRAQTATTTTSKKKSHLIT